MAKTTKYGSGSQYVNSPQATKAWVKEQLQQEASWIEKASEVTVRYVEPIGVKRPWAKRKSRAAKRALGTNPRSLGTNPRAKGTNPRSIQQEAETA